MRAGQSARIILPLPEGVNRLCLDKDSQVREVPGDCKPVGHGPGNKSRPSGVLLFEQFCGPIRVVPITMAMSKNPKAKNRSEMKPAYPFLSLPKAQGLYRPENEHDACGIGFVANIEGQKSHDIVLKGIQILINLTHRGACGCDPETGDGAGILIQIPHAFFERECTQLGFTLPAPGEYGVGMVFLPVDPQERMLCEGMLEKIAREAGLDGAGLARHADQRQHDRARWRAASQPYIEQIFVRRGPGMDQDALERKLYVVRKRAESLVAESDLKEKGFFYIPSLSSRTIVYKGLLAGAADHRFLQGAVGSGSDQRAVPGAPALFDEHVSELASWRIPTATSATTAKSIRCAGT